MQRHFTPDSMPQTEEPDFTAEAPPEIRREQTAATAEIYDPKTVPWDSIRQDVMEMVNANMGDTAFSEGMMKSFLENPKNVTSLLRKDEDGRVIGYSSAIPASSREKAKTAYIYSTDIRPDYQGQGLVGKIMDVLEAELRRQGYQFVTRDSAAKNGYADKVQKHYADRLAETPRDHDSPYGPQRHFKIRL